jgi:hypothetical protein
VLVHFDYDLDGPLKVRAEDRPTGRAVEHQIDMAGKAEITVPDNLSVEERGVYRRLAALARRAEISEGDRARAKSLTERAPQESGNAKWLEEALELLYRIDPEY